jgi:hypothetical protein
MPPGNNLLDPRGPGHPVQILKSLRVYLCVCVCRCVCVCVCVCRHIHFCIFRFRHTFSKGLSPVILHSISAGALTFGNVLLNIYICIYMYMHYIHIYMYIYIHTYTHTYIHIWGSDFWECVGMYARALTFGISHDFHRKYAGALTFEHVLLNIYENICMYIYIYIYIYIYMGLTFENVLVL